MTRKPALKNALGSALREIRESNGWTLEQTAKRLRDAGLVCSARRLGDIEAQRAGIKDFEILYFTAVLGVTQEALWQRLAPRKT